MCGIVGIIQYASPIPRDIRMRALRILFSELMLRTEVRGDDATGIYQVHQNGDWAMAKKGQKASDWLYVPKKTDTDPVIYRDFMDTWDEHPFDLSALVGHCRKATIGGRGEDNNDNHPFAIQLDEKNALLGIHNGTLLNHEVIHKKLESHLPRHGSVDSEILFQLMYHATEEGTKPITPEALRYMGERVDGAYAVISVNTRFPNQVAVFRYERPMEFFMVSPLNIVVIVSEKKFMNSALERYQFTREILDPTLPQLSHTDRILVERDYRIFDATREFPTGSLVWKDFDAISSTGEMRKVGQAVLDEWKTPVAKTTTTTATTHYTNPVTKAPPATTAQPVIPLGAGSSAKVTKEEKEGEGEGVLVDVIEPVKNSPEYVKAKSLGLGIYYDDLTDLTRHLGITSLEVDKLTAVKLANVVSEYSFSLGYALACVDRKAEVEEVRRKGREQLSTMEKTAEKQKKAERRIWAMKQLLLFAMSLYKKGYPLTPKNVSYLLQGFPTLGEQSRKDIEEAAKNLLDDHNAMKLVRDIVANIEKADKVKRGEA